jgi:hypothetical protein
MSSPAILDSVISPPSSLLSDSKDSLVSESNVYSASDSTTSFYSSDSSSDVVTTPESVSPDITKVRDAIEPYERSARRFERPMGDTEVSYYLPSRESGVNDMCACPGLIYALLMILPR